MSRLLAVLFLIAAVDAAAAQQPYIINGQLFYPKKGERFSSVGGEAQIIRSGETFIQDGNGYGILVGQDGAVRKTIVQLQDEAIARQQAEQRRLEAAVRNEVRSALRNAVYIDGRIVGYTVRTGSSVRFVPAR